MKCSRRSTTWCASAVALAVSLGMAPGTFAEVAPGGSRGAAGAAGREVVDRAVRAAIVAAVTTRVGEGVTVRVEALRVNGTVPVAGLAAVPESSARAARAAVFSLSAGSGRGRRRVGSAVAVVRLSGPSLRAARALTRGEALRDADVVEASGELGEVPLRALPDRADVVGARAARDVAEGDPLTDAVVRAVPLVQSGDEVVVRARIGGVEAEGRALAAQAGGAGAVIQVVNPETRRVLKGRVIGRGEVEVIHEAN